jgi:ATP-dependent Clp protease ATP-binding subunit ClpX
LLNQYQYLFDPVKLLFSDDALETLAEQALKDGTGARGLRGQLDKILTPLQYKLCEQTETVTSILVNNAVVTGTGDPLYTFKKPTTRAKRAPKLSE